MKAFAFFCALLVAGACAEPVKVVESPTFHRGILQILADVGRTLGDFLERVDPLTVDFYHGDTEILNLVPAGISVESLAFAGFSNLEVTRAEYDDGVLSVDIAFVNVWFSADLIRLYVGSAAADFSGSIAVENLGLSLDLHVDTEDGLVIEDFDLVFKRPILSAALRVTALGNDYTDVVLHFLNVRLPFWVDNNGHRIGEIVRDIIWRIIESIRENSY